LEAVVIETSKDVRGPLVSVVVRNGSLKVGEVVSVQGMTAKIKNLFSDRGEAIKEALPGHGVLILGFGELPPVGAQLVHSNEPVKPSVSLKKTSKIEKLTKEQIPIILKAQNTGALDAVLASLPGGIVALEAGVGEINESDILLAKSFVVRMVLGFESKANHSVKKLAEAEGVKIETYDIIYELIQRLEEIVKKGKIDIIGKAEIVKIFPFNQKKVAGCKVVEGKISKTDSLILLRADKQLGKVRAVSLRKGKQEIIEAKAGEELGILFDPQLDFEKGDMLVSVAK
jgi:translation initiation factor IF-2